MLKLSRLGAQPQVARRWRATWHVGVRITRLGKSSRQAAARERALAQLVADDEVDDAELLEKGEVDLEADALAADAEALADERLEQHEHTQQAHGQQLPSAAAPQQLDSHLDEQQHLIQREHHHHHHHHAAHRHNEQQQHFLHEQHQLHEQHLQHERPTKLHVVMPLPHSVAAASTSPPSVASSSAPTSAPAAPASAEASESTADTPPATQRRPLSPTASAVTEAARQLHDECISNVMYVSQRGVSEACGVQQLM